MAACLPRRSSSARAGNPGLERAEDGASLPLRPRTLALLLACGTLLPSLTTLADDEDAATVRWQALTPGLAYREVTPDPGGGHAPFTLHVFRVELGQYRAVVAEARQPGSERLAAPVRKLARERGAALAVNGSFFDEQRRPLGLLIEQGRELRPLRRADWGVLYVEQGQAHLVHTRQFREAPPPREGIEFAIQVGPRLVAEGKPLHLKQQWAERTAVGILPDGALLVVVSQGAAVESNELAQLMAAPPSEGGLGCREALMMDGGPSTQLFARVGDFHLDLPGSYGVPIAVAFVRREAPRPAASHPVVSATAP